MATQPVGFEIDDTFTAEPVAAPAPSEGGLAIDDSFTAEAPTRGAWRRLSDSFTEAGQYGFPGFVARKWHDWTDTGVKELRQKYPGQSDDWYEEKADAFIVKAQRALRDDMAAKQEADPTWKPDENFWQNAASIERWGPYLAGQIGGSAGPESLVNPGASAFERIAAQFSANALADAAYQGIDLMEQIRDEFSVDQMIGAGAAGAGLQGAFEVPSFVRNLFKQRGADTTPAATPEMSAEMTPKPVTLSPEDEAAYQGLLENGSVGDILGFFKERKGYDVDVEQVQKYVKARDAGIAVSNEVIYKTPAGGPLEESLANEATAFTQRQRPDEGIDLATEASEFTASPEPDPEAFWPSEATLAKRDEALAKRLTDEVNTFKAKDTDIPELGVRQNAEPVVTPMTRKARDRIDTITANWKNAPEFEVVSSINDIADPEIRAKVQQEGATNAKGFVGPDGKVRIIAENITDEADIPAIVFHEALGHNGMTQLFRDGLDDVLTKMYNEGPDFKARVDNWLANNPSAYANDPNVVARAADEVLAEMSEAGILTPTLINKVKNYLKQLARRMGLRGVEYSQREIETILGMAHEAVLEGAESASANGFRWMRAANDNRLEAPKQPAKEASDSEWATYYRKSAQYFYKKADEYDSKGKTRHADTARNRAALEERAADRRDPDGKSPSFRESALFYRKQADYYQRQMDRRFARGDREGIERYRLFRDDASEKAAAYAEDSLRYMRGPELISDNFSEGAVRRGNLTYEDTSNTKKYRQVYAEYEVPDKDPLKLSLLIDKDTGTAKINIETDKIDSATDHVGTVGIRNLREGLKELSSAFPEVTKFEGIRWTGAGGSQRVTQSARPVRYTRSDERPKSSLSPEGMRTSKDVSDVLDFLGRDFERREPTPVAWTNRVADDLGITPSKYIKKEGLTEQKFAAQIRAAHNLLTTQIDDLEVLGTKAREEGMTPSLYANIRQKLAIVEAVYAKFDADTSELGRALRMLREAGESRRSAEAALKFMKESEGADIVSNPEHLMRFLDNLSVMKQTNGSESAAKFVKLTKQKKWEDYASSLVFNSMLSSPVTWKINFLSTGANLINEIGVKGLASIGGQLTRGGENLNRVTGREMMARLYGPIMAFRNWQTWRNVYDALATGEDKVGTPNKVRNERLVYRGTPLAPIEIPHRIMAGSDEFWRNFAQMSNLYGESAKEAVEKGLKGSDFWDAVNASVANPSKEALEKATSDTQRILFRERPSKYAQSLLEKMNPRYEDTVELKMATGDDGKNRFVAKTVRPKNTQPERAGKFFLKTIVPFVPTLESIARTAVRNSGPLAFASNSIRQDLRAGGAARHSAMARIALSSATMATWAALAMDGKITGVENPDYKKQAGLGAVRPPYSIKVGDEWVSYKGLDPLSSQIAAVATSVERRKDSEAPISMEDGKNLIIGMAAALKENSYAESLFNMMELIQEGSSILTEGKDPTYVTANLVGGHASNILTPNFVRWVNQEFIDPYARDATGDDSVSDRIYGRAFSGMPSPVANAIGLEGSQDFPQRYDAFGRPALNARQERFEEEDPTILELDRLERLSDKLVLGLVGPRAKVDGEERRLTAEEYQAYQQLSGLWIVEDVRAEMETEDWQLMTDEEKIAAVKKIVKDARKAAREELFSPEEDVNE